MLTSPDQAYELIMGRIASRRRPTPVGVVDGRGAITQSVCADRDLPALPLSQMDGYAIIAPVAADVCMPVVAETPAGSPPARELRDGEAVRIFTGAALPPGANAVVEQESTTRTGGSVVVHRAVEPGEYVIPPGSVVREGEEALPEGAPMGAAQAGIAAAVGATPPVNSRPAVAIVCTGAEVVAPSESPAPYQIRNSNGPALAAALLSSGFAVAGQELIDDQLEALMNRLWQCIHSEAVDALITVGGVSVGDYDLVPKALKQVGCAIHLHKVALKPGKPFLFATAEEAMPIFGLPGNPVSALTSFFDFVAPALRKLGARPQPWRPTLSVTLTDSVRGDRERTFMALAHVENDDDGGWHAEPLPVSHSGDIFSAARADGAIIVPPGASLRTGEMARFRPWRPLW